jgi:hypothetical protein
VSRLATFCFWFSVGLVLFNALALDFVSVVPVLHPVRGFFILGLIGGGVGAVSNFFLCRKVPSQTRSP